MRTRTPLQLRAEVIAIRSRWYRREVTLEQVSTVVDEYREALKAHAKKKGWKSLRVPGRSCLLRAL